MFEFMVCVGICGVIFSFIYFLMFNRKWHFLFDEEIINIARRRRETNDGEMREMDDGLYVYSKKEHDWLCIDKHEKIISDFNNALENANYKNKIRKRD